MLNQLALTLEDFRGTIFSNIATVGGTGIEEANRSFVYCRRNYYATIFMNFVFFKFEMDS